MSKRYSIAFDTKDAPGRVKATWVEIGTWFMRADSIAHIDLHDHPLYSDLEAYVLAHPSGKVKTS